MDDSQTEDLASAIQHLDEATTELLDFLLTPDKTHPPGALSKNIEILLAAACAGLRTDPIIGLFDQLREIRQQQGYSADCFGISRNTLVMLAEKHRVMDEHGVTVGGRVNHALPLVRKANTRVDAYLNQKRIEAPSGIELWESIQANALRIQSALGMRKEEWDTYSGQIQNCINDVDTLARIIDLPTRTINEITRVTRTYRMRLTPYYASLIQPGIPNDPILLQSVPTAEMVDNIGAEIPPVAADHSPARLIDQFYPRVVTIKATNMCAMYCTHCLRIAHIGKKDRTYSKSAYEEALTYIRTNSRIRDVLITGGDAFVLPNHTIKNILEALDGIDHVRMKRLGTRIPVTAPQRIDTELLEILAASNDRKPLRVVTQINTAQEITPLSENAFKKISKSVCAVLNQAVLLKGVNDSRVKMWKLCETIQESYVRPYYVFNCSYRNPQFAHFRVPVERGRDIVESMYGNISGDAIPRYIATAGGKIPLHRDNVRGTLDGNIILKKPWNGAEVAYPDANPRIYAERRFAFTKS